MNLLSFLSDSKYDVDFHVHVVSPMEFNEMIDLLVFYSPLYNLFPYPGLQYEGEREGGLHKETTWRKVSKKGNLF